MRRVKNLMKKYRIVILSVICIIILVAFTISFKYFGNKEVTKVEDSLGLTLEECPRLEDDFYSNINFDYLSQNVLADDENIDYFSDRTEEIEDEKEKIISELLEEKSSIGTKVSRLYESYENATAEETLSVLNNYIEKINSASNIEEFVENVILVNYELGTDILYSPNVLQNQYGENTKYFGFDFVTYDFDNLFGFYYANSDYEDVLKIYKKYEIKILEECGYSLSEATEIIENVQAMYKVIGRFSALNNCNTDEDVEEYIYGKYSELYTIDELQEILENFPIEKIVSYYKDFFDGEILVEDINQLKTVNSYLKDENLDTLKKYALLKILTTYSNYISSKCYEIYYDYECEVYNIVNKEEITDEKIANNVIYAFFKDTITEEFAKKYFTEEQKDFFEGLVQDEIEILKEMIDAEDWLSDETKEKARLKMDKMTYTVGIPDDIVKVENNYKIEKSALYIENIINMRKNLKYEEMRQFKLGNDMYNIDEMDQLTYNAYYNPTSNSINILLGYIYSVTDAFNCKEDFENNYYKILGSVGFTIGHELTHALDDSRKQF
jgi:putative endopeptidase